MTPEEKQHIEQRSYGITIAQVAQCIDYHGGDYLEYAGSISRAATNRLQMLTAAGQELARINAVWPDKSTDGQIITVGKRQGRDIYPVRQYRLDGDKQPRVRA